ncbi:MAG: hypothetical protein COV75_03985 [Candidatus Omnitrophica bacterium CG11_big_fil_rev_8_21_14_0_20_63_9]|nr:MAG: hypothetical protein COV75_03985 [Candidatus Omnitrophica bacterium CG11_big_fil_rev_8_21_14_0_20_63_9]
MSVLPQVSGARLVHALQKAGFIIKRQHGSHVILGHPTNVLLRAVVPVHGSKPVKPGTLRAILKGIGMTPADLRRWL